MRPMIQIILKKKSLRKTALYNSVTGLANFFIFIYVFFWTGNELHPQEKHQCSEQIALKGELQNIRSYKGRNWIR